MSVIDIKVNTGFYIGVTGKVGIPYNKQDMQVEVLIA